MALEGSITEFGLGEILQLIFHQKKEGILTIRSGKQEAQVCFVKGQVVNAITKEAAISERIGEVLVKAERLTPDQLQEALSMQQRTGDPIGKVLTRLHFITPEDLKRALRLQVCETIYRIFRLKEGEYRFEPQEVAYDQEFLEPISTEFLLMEAIRRLDEWPLVLRRVPSFDRVYDKVPGKEPVVTPPEGGGDPFDPEQSASGGITPEEARIYDLVNGKRTVQALVEISQIGEFETCKALANLATGGWIKSAPTTGVRTLRAVAGFAHEQVRQAIRGVLSTLVAGLAAFLIFANLSRIGTALGELRAAQQKIRHEMAGTWVYHHREAQRIAILIQGSTLSGSELVEAGYLTPNDLARSRSLDPQPN